LDLKDDRSSSTPPNWQLSRRGPVSLSALHMWLATSVTAARGCKLQHHAQYHQTWPGNFASCDRWLAMTYNLTIIRHLTSQLAHQSVLLHQIFTWHDARCACCLSVRRGCRKKINGSHSPNSRSRCKPRGVVPCTPLAVYAEKKIHGSHDVLDKRVSQASE
jgi:hypothetical protein